MLVYCCFLFMTSHVLKYAFFLVHLKYFFSMPNQNNSVFSTLLLLKTMCLRRWLVKYLKWIIGWHTPCSFNNKRLMDLEALIISHRFLWNCSADMTLKSQNELVHVLALRTWIACRNKFSKLDITVCFMTWLLTTGNLYDSYDVQNGTKDPADYML